MLRFISYVMLIDAHLLLITMPKVEWAGQQVAIFLNYTTAGKVKTEDDEGGRRPMGGVLA